MKYVVFVRPSGRPSVLRGKNFNVGHYYHANCSTIFVIYLACSYALTSTILYRFADLDLAWGSQGQRKAKPIGFTFSHSLHLIKMKFDGVMKQFKLNILRLFLMFFYVCLFVLFVCFVFG